MGEKCEKCGNPLNMYSRGRLCRACQLKKIEAMADGTKPYYDVPDLMEIMGLESEEQVKRLGRKRIIPGRIPGIKAHRYVKDEVDQWIRSGGLPLHKPTNPLQQEAYDLCIKKDHGWLRDDKFAGLAYTQETVSATRRFSMNVGEKRTCYFCGHSEIVSI